MNGVDVEISNFEVVKPQNPVSVIDGKRVWVRRSKHKSKQRIIAIVLGVHVFQQIPGCVLV